MIPLKQLSLAEIFDDCQNEFDNDKYPLQGSLGRTFFPVRNARGKEKSGMRYEKAV